MADQIPRGAPPDVKLKSNGDYWQAYWQTPTGRRVRSLGPKSGLSRRQANVKCRDLALELARDTALGRDRSAPRLSEWIATYTKLRTDVSPGTRELIGYAGRYLLGYFEADPPINRISRSDAADWRRALASGELSLDNANHCDPPGEATVCKHVRTVKKMFAEAEAQDWVAFNPFGRLKGNPPKPVREWPQITAAETTAILDACPDAAWRALFALCRYAGLRRGEALRLRWADIRWDRNQIVVNADVKRQTTKHRLRVVPIEPKRCPSGLTAILQECREAAAEGAVLVCAGIRDHRKWNLDGAARAIIAAAGVPPYAKPFHTLRKCLETEWAAHYPQHVVSEWLGHSIEVSAAHYLRVPAELYEAPESGGGQDGEAQNRAQTARNAAGAEAGGGA